MDTPPPQHSCSTQPQSTGNVDMVKEWALDIWSTMPPFFSIIFYCGKRVRPYGTHILQSEFYVEGPLWLQSMTTPISTRLSTMSPTGWTISTLSRKQSWKIMTHLAQITLGLFKSLPNGGTEQVEGHPQVKMGSCWCLVSCEGQGTGHKPCRVSVKKVCLFLYSSYLLNWHISVWFCWWHHSAQW